MDPIIAERVQPGVFSRIREEGSGHTRGFAMPFLDASGSFGGALMQRIEDGLGAGGRGLAVPSEQPRRIARCALEPLEPQAVLCRVLEELE